MANKYVTVTGAGTKAGTSWVDAFGYAEFITDLASVVAGDNYWIKEGTYTATANLTVSTSGTSVNKVSLTGVTSGTTAEPPTVSDYASGTARPIFSGAYYMYFPSYYNFLNLRFDSSNTSYTLQAISFFKVQNCYIRNTGTGNTLNIVGYLPLIINNEIITTNGNGIYYTGFSADVNAKILFNYIHDSSVGIHSSYSDLYCIEYNIIDTCTTGITIGSTDKHHIVSNTFYNGTTAIAGTDPINTVILNNTFSTFTDAIKFTSTAGQTMVDYNNYYNNTTDVTGVTKGFNALAIDPQFTDATNGDFSLVSGSALIGAGMGISLGVG